MRAQMRAERAAPVGGVRGDSRADPRIWRPLARFAAATGSSPSPCMSHAAYHRRRCEVDRPPFDALAVPQGARPLPDRRHDRHRAGRREPAGSRSARSRRCRSIRPSSGSSPRSPATRGRRWRRPAGSASTSSATSRPSCAGASPRAASATTASIDVTWTHSPTGCPIIEGVGAWIDCTVEHSFELGDHYFVVGRVVDLGHDEEPHDAAGVLQGRARRLPRRRVTDWTAVSTSWLGAVAVDVAAVLLFAVAGRRATTRAPVSRRS